MPRIQRKSGISSAVSRHQETTPSDRHCSPPGACAPFANLANSARTEVAAPPAAPISTAVSSSGGVTPAGHPNT